MANPSSFNISREDLIKEFSTMSAIRKPSWTPITYTHFIPQFPVELNKRENLDSWWKFPIYECNCADMGRSTRVVIEKLLVEKVINVFDKTKLFTLYSLGSGCCYQELSLCVRFAKKNCQIGKIVLVDYEYKTGIRTNEGVAAQEFSKFAKILFPDVEISTYTKESEYFEDIKISKQPKPDIILGIDVESALLSRRQENYAKMLETSQAVLCYYNHKNRLCAGQGTELFVDTIQGQD